MEETESHVARTKVVLTTVRLKQVEERGDRTHVFWPGVPDANPQAQTEVNPGGSGRKSVVKPTRCEASIGCAEPVIAWRRQHLGSELGYETQGHPGAVGWACGEGRLGEGGRSHEVPGREAGSTSPRPRSRVAIRVHPETRPGASWEVGEVRSSEEAAVIAVDAKGPHFGAALGGERDRPSPREG